MLEGLDPSVALTGGPWYTDNELDTEFIQHLTEACLKFIRDLVSQMQIATQPVKYLTFLFLRVSQNVVEVHLRGLCMRYPIPLNIQAPSKFAIR